MVAFYAPRDNPGTHFCWSLSRLQGHSAAGRIVSMKNTSDTVENRTHDLPICSAVLQQLLHCVLRGVGYRVVKCMLELNMWVSFQSHTYVAYLLGCWKVFIHRDMTVSSKRLDVKSVNRRSAI